MKDFPKPYPSPHSIIRHTPITPEGFNTTLWFGWNITHQYHLTDLEGEGKGREGEGGREREREREGRRERESEGGRGRERERERKKTSQKCEYLRRTTRLGRGGRQNAKLFSPQNDELPTVVSQVSQSNTSLSVPSKCSNGNSDIATSYSLVPLVTKFSSTTPYISTQGSKFSSTTPYITTEGV